MAVEAWDIRGVEAGHCLGFDNEVLEALVERVAEVDGAVGVGRPVVQKVAGRALARLANLLVELLIRPLFEP